MIDLNPPSNHKPDISPTEMKPNHLINENSPYLLQHLYNPVDWYPYSPVAFEKAKQENKPIFLSIGYSACHWCHVMAHESFENTQIAEILNQSFISIKVDKEERPDLDQVYQSAVQLMGKQGGWPLSVFLTPDRKPFFGGTYFPSTSRYGMMGFPDLLKRIISVYQTNREQIDQSGDQVLDVIQDTFQSRSFNSKFSIFDIANEQNFRFALDEILLNADLDNGGFGTSPKFPSYLTLLFLMRQIQENQIQIPNDIHHISLPPMMLEQMQHIVILTLDKMAMGGIFDQIGGGFARYSVDDHWEIPHFEKMLYDNAMALIAYSEGYALFHKNLYKNIVRSIINWARSEMYDGKHGFYSTLDADSEGHEGRYYLWTKSELDRLIPKEEQVLFYTIYNISEIGNFESGYNHLNQSVSPEELAQQWNISPAEIERRLDHIKDMLFKHRQTRVFPHRDEKIITSWNALFAHGLFQAAKIFLDEEFGSTIQTLALDVNAFIRTEMWNNSSGQLFRSFFHDHKTHLGFLDDYAYFLQSLLDEFEQTHNKNLIPVLESIRHSIEQHFWDEEKQLFYYSNRMVQDLEVRPRLDLDNPLPSPSAVMIENYLQFYFYFNDQIAQKKAHQLLQMFGELAVHHPLEYSMYWLAAQWARYGSTDIGIISEDFIRSSTKTASINQQIFSHYIPRLHFYLGSKPDPHLTPFSEKSNKKNPIVYSLCLHYNCFPLLFEESQFYELLKLHFKTTILFSSKAEK